jgi:hypothetical protein
MEKRLDEKSELEKSGFEKFLSVKWPKRKQLKKWIFIWIGILFMSMIFLTIVLILLFLYKTDSTNKINTDTARSSTISYYKNSSTESTNQITSKGIFYLNVKE